MHISRRIELALFVCIVGVTILLFVLFRGASSSFEEELARAADFDTTTWFEYRSEQYDVSLRYPDRWKLEVSDEALSPMIRVLAPDQEAPSGTLTSLGAQVSIFPKGMPTSFTNELPGVLPFFEQHARAHIRRGAQFSLEDGSAFAELHRYSRTPVSWTPSGFVWAQGDVSGTTADCIAQVPVIAEEARRCDLLFGDRVVYRGRVRSFDMELVDAIVDSIRFYGSVQSETTGTSSVEIIEPSEHATVRSPMRVRGTAPASWFFEGEIPIRILDAHDVVLAEASAPGSFEQGMTGEAVPFSASVSFERPETRAGTLLLQKANPSGAAQLSEHVRIPVVF